MNISLLLAVTCVIGEGLMHGYMACCQLCYCSIENPFSWHTSLFITATQHGNSFLAIYTCRRSEDTALFILKEVYQEPKPELIKS